LPAEKKTRSGRPPEPGAVDETAAREAALSVAEDADWVRRFRPRRPMEFSRREYVEGIRAGDRTILSRAITLVESTLPAQQELAQQIVENCLPYTGNSIRVGITGVPGSGKSTFIEALGLHLVRERGQKVAVLAVDPTSQISGGSILGDKTRMEKLSACLEAFIRPSPSGGSLGGVARKTRECILLCEAAGYGNTLVETVGVGQSESAVRAMVDFLLLLVLPGAGDELQGIKRGVIELADLIAINKADGENRRQAEAARIDYENALRLSPPHAGGWVPEVTTCSAREGAAIGEVWDTVLRHREQMLATGQFHLSRQEQAKLWMRETIRYGLEDRFRSHPAVRERLLELERAVAEGKASPIRAATQLLAQFLAQAPE